ncbi:unnamed protein product [Linum trigynum]|uniref:C2H2-type domain-containing protein n=1 Tax=Linum trigynum TaxID=586398 RepID=A0AAV2ESS6_9ROSI
MLAAILIFVLASFPQAFSQEVGEIGGERSIEAESGHELQVHCSRERSRAAWKVIDEYLMPFVEQERYQIPSKCRLHPSNDLFRDQEQHKINYDFNQWQCGYCKKSFRAEKYLDQHFDNRHFDRLNVTDGKCLADLCGALHCDHVMDSRSVKKTRCNLAATAKNRHLCESLADRCFPLNLSPSAARLHELFLRQFCDALTCSGKKKIFPKGGKKSVSVFYLAISILSLMLLPLFYLIVYLHQSEIRRGTQQLRRITRVGKMKPS